MRVQKIKSGRVNGISAANYVGEKGQIFYNEDLGDLRLSDGSTMGGIPLVAGASNSRTASSTIAGTVKIGANITLAPDGTISVAEPFSGNYLDLFNAPVVPTDISQLADSTGLLSQVNIASDSILGVVKVGNELGIASDGTLNVDLSAVGQAIVPDTDAFYSLGTADYRWKDLHVSAGSIYIDDLRLSDSNGTLLLGESLTADVDPNTVFRSVKDSNDYVSLSLQNTNSGNKASSDLLLYSDLNTTSVFADLGIASSGYNYPGYEIIKPSDTYLIGAGGELKLGTTLNKAIVLFNGGTGINNEIARFDDNGLSLVGDISFSNGNTFSGDYSQLSNTPSPYQLPVASDTALGGIKLGTGLHMDSNNVVSVVGAASSAGTFKRYEFPVAALEWTVVHGMNTKSFMERLTDSEGNRIYAALNIVDFDSFTVNLTTATSGSIDIFF